MITIRRFSTADVGLVQQWWQEAKGTKVDFNYLPGDSTFIAEIKGTPALCVSLILTNTPLAWLELFIGNPKTKGPLRKIATTELLQFLRHFARKRGYRRFFCMGPNEKLAHYYESLGFKKTAEVSTFIMEIGHA